MSGVQEGRRARAWLLGICALIAALLLAPVVVNAEAPSRVASTEDVSAAPAESDWDHLDVSLLTMEPGPVYWERFGHNAIEVRDRRSGRAIAYNFGYFDFQQQDFFWRFLKGRMLYMAVALDSDEDVQRYLAAGRRVWVQQLNLSAAQKRSLISHLEWHVQPAQRDYRYDYFRNNCSTKLRDALDLALGGELQRQTAHRSHGWSHRRYTRAYAQGLPWLYLGTDLGLGQATDVPLSLWEEMFIPGELKRRLRELVISDGEGQRPLVAREYVLPAEADSTEVWPLAPEYSAWFAGVGLLLGSLMILLAYRLDQRGAAARWYLRLKALVAGLVGLGGVLLLFLWLGTDHEAAWRNENLFWMSPLWCVVAVASWRWAAVLGREADGRRAQQLWQAWLLVAALLGLGLSLKLFRSFDQGNLEWLWLAAPLTLAYGQSIRLLRKRSAG